MPYLLAQIRTWHRPLMIAVAAMATLVAVSAIGLIADHRQLLDASVWAKPQKFGISFVIYSATLAWMLPQLTKAKRTMWTLGSSPSRPPAAPTVTSTPTPTRST